jgi:hypothetical protein
MDMLPNRDTVAAFEQRLGKPLMSVLIWVLAVAIIFGSLGVIAASLRATFSALQPYLPTPAWADWAFRGGFIALLVTIGIWVSVKLDRLERALTVTPE